MTETAMEILERYDMPTVEDEAENQGYQIFVCNITWNPEELKSTYHTKKQQEPVELPTQFTMELPENVRNQAMKKKNNFNDVVESFIFNFLTHKFNHEVWNCQIYLPLDK